MTGEPAFAGAPPQRSIVGKYSGDPSSDMAPDSSNDIAIRPAGSNRYKIDVNGCGENMEGVSELTAGKLHLSKRNEEGVCTLTLSSARDGLLVEESKACGFVHGAVCAYRGTFPRVNEVAQRTHEKEIARDWVAHTPAQYDTSEQHVLAITGGQDKSNSLSLYLWDLNGDGVPEAVVDCQGLCQDGDRSGQSTTIFRKTSAGWVKLFAAGSGGGGIYTAAHITRDGWPDLRIDSACANDEPHDSNGCHTLAWWDGERYRSYKDKPPPKAASLSTAKGLSQYSRSAAARPTLQPADFPAFEAGALCREDPRGVLSRMPPSAETATVKAYQPPPGLTVNGWRVVGVYYRLQGLQTGGYMHVLTTFVHAPPAQVLAWARTQPKINPQATTGDRAPEDSDLARYAAAGGIPLQMPAVEYIDSPVMTYELADRAREVLRVVADSGSTGMISCAQIDASALQGAAEPSRLGPVTRIAAAPDLPQDFVSGTFRISKSAPGGCKGLYEGGADFNAAMIRDDWNTVARKAVALGCKADITYFLLGRATEAIGRPDAAGSYYREAARIAGTPTLRFSEQCALNRPRVGSGSNGCLGVDVAAEAKAAQFRLAVTPPALGPFPLLDPSRPVAQAQPQPPLATPSARASAAVGIPSGYAPPRFRNTVYDPDAPPTHRAPTDCEFAEAFATVAGVRAGPSRCKTPPSKREKARSGHRTVSTKVATEGRP